MRERPKPPAIDANILLRFLVNDIPEQADACAALFKRVEAGSEQVILPDLVLADVVWTLEKFYRQPKTKIREVLVPILALKKLMFSSKKTALLALKLYAEKNLDWTDAFVASQMMVKRVDAIYSYDQDFDKVPEITRLEP